MNLRKDHYSGGQALELEPLYPLFTSICCFGRTAGRLAVGLGRLVPVKDPKNP